MGTLRAKQFKFHAVGHRHLNRNKSARNRREAKRDHFLGHTADIKKLRRMMPYYKRRKANRR